MIFNERILRTPTSQLEDFWQGELTLCDSVISKTDCIRYLGTEIDTFDKGDRHIKRLKQKVISAIAKLNSIGTLLEKKIKLEFMKRLINNTYTKKLIEETLPHTLEKDLISEVIEIIDGENEPLINNQRLSTSWK
ncbi:hypothetical protein BpHYR1_034291 [Brachionus plicatilis]|uniref:RNA-directed DNA polymerase from mobile element jockey-like n=1 Tax=Brachionus plicatilis TaxID=10195 RepID=A0A3M7RUZ1_BRAPC|nr:hypothetical protein BpHYR1_034291 [Brachionus plicatilis]